MNCRVAREAMTDSLAGGGRELHQEVSTHQELCPECKAFYEQEEERFSRIDAGLRGIVNAEVPTSLLPKVRSALGKPQSSPAFALKHWPLAALAASVLLMCAGAIWFLQGRPDVVPPAAPQVTRVTPPSIELRSSPPEVKATLRVVPRHKVGSLARPEKQEATPEVIVLPEEREAFARFVADSSERERAALSKSALPAVDEVEIALLEIQSIEITPVRPQVHE